MSFSFVKAIKICHAPSVWRHGECFMIALKWMGFLQMWGSRLPPFWEHAPSGLSIYKIWCVTYIWV
jgi:hypothetical protein